jgi:Protein of unknown function (DUF998)
LTEKKLTGGILMSLSAWLALGSGILLLIGVLSLLGLHLGAPDLNPIRDAVSLYVHAPHGVLYRVQAIAKGVGALCLLGALLTQGISLPLVGLIMLGLYAVCRAAVAGFISDPRPPLTRRGVIHLLLGTIMFIAIACATGFLTSPLSALPLWQGLSLLLIGTTAITVGSVTLTFAVSTQARMHHLLGAVERGIYVGSFGWMVCTLFPLLKG